MSQPKYTNPPIWILWNNHFTHQKIRKKTRMNSTAASTTQKPRKMVNSLRNNKQHYWVEYHFSSQHKSSQQDEAGKCHSKDHKSFASYANNASNHYKIKTIMTPIVNLSKATSSVPTSSQGLLTSQEPTISTRSTRFQQPSTTKTSYLPQKVVDKRLSLQYILN